MSFQAKLLIALSVVLLSFTLIEKTEFDFRYPQKDKALFSLKSDLFAKFSSEWRGNDFYYFSTGRGFLCSVLFYQVKPSDKKTLIDDVRMGMNVPEISPAYAFSYFSNSSDLKDFEMNNSTWGKVTDDFMFRQNDVQTNAGTQKHMYGYAMVDKDLFVNVHLSKAACTPADSIAMMDILKSLKRMK